MLEKTLPGDAMGDKDLIIFPWDAVGTFRTINFEEVLQIELYMLNVNYSIEYEKITSIQKLREVLKLKPEEDLPEEFRDTDDGTGYQDGDFALYIHLKKHAQTPLGLPGKQFFEPQLKKVPEDGKPFFIALHVNDTPKKYRRKTEAIVQNHPIVEYIKDVLVR